MKKHVYLIAGAFLVALASCKEVGPKIDFGGGAASGDDTTYVAEKVEAPQQKKVLAEEFTGVSCPTCPPGHSTMKGIQSTLNNNLVIMGCHIFNNPQSKPVDKPGHESEQDFRTEDATELLSAIYGSLKEGIPSAGFDRMPINGEALNTKGKWSDAANNRTVVAAPVNIYITTSYDNTTREAVAIVKIAYTKETTVKQNLTVAVTEDEITDTQLDGLNIIDDYKHEHVLRDIVTPVTGATLPVKVEPRVAGRVYQRTFRFKIDAKWKPEHCNVIAFVNTDEGANKEVVQAEEVKLIP
ncbi:MAG: Omp28-related outer membrane protein [Flavipsychrobacter sp.]